jgi:hypothetical protein
MNAATLPEGGDHADRVEYLSPAIRAAWTDLIASAPIYHISQKTLAEIESLRTVEINAAYAGKPRCAIAFVVDDAAPAEPSASRELASTEMLLLDARKDVWRFYERSKIQWPHELRETQIVGVVWGLRKRLYGSAGEHPQGYFLAQDFTAWGVIRSALGLLWLSEHDEVTISDAGIIGGRQHWIIDVPAHLTAENAIADLLKGNHIKSRPSGLHRLMKSAARFLKTRRTGKQI